MNLRALLFICCTTILFSTVEANAQEGKNNEPKQVIQIKKMDDQVSELMADRISIRKDMELKELAAINEKAVLSMEELLFPADELYGSHWENQFVDPFRGKIGVNFPDSFDIDCTSFIYPIKIDSMARVTSNYGPRRRRMHKGIDLKVLKTDTIVAAFDGRIRIKSYEAKGYGHYVVIRHPNGLETVYGHLSKVLVNTDQIIRAGEPIGLGGNTGRSTGSHLHFETRFLGQAINPAEIIDFSNGTPHLDTYTFKNIKINGRKSNIYTSSTDQMVFHRVKSGDTLGKIARMYGTSVNELCRLNGLKATSTLRIGQSIRCSAGGGTAVTPAPSASPVKTPTAQPAKTTVQADAAAVASVQAEAGNDASEPVYHRVKQGDSLSKIASKYGTSVSKLCELNGITRNTVLKLGRSLRCS